MANGAKPRSKREMAGAASSPPPVALVAAAGALVPQDAVAIPSKRYREMAEERELPRTLMGGTKAMRKAATRYLKPHDAESQGSYEHRLNSTTLYNGFEETVKAQAGKFFAEPIVLKDTVPPEIAALCENIDGQGRALTPFIADGVKEAFVDGIFYVLPDFPAMQAGATLADQRAMGARPYWVRVLAGDLIGLKTRSVGGKQIITQVRIKESVDEDDGEFGQKEVERIRVLEPGRWRVYEKRDLRNESGQTSKHWILADEGVTSLNYVPLVPFYVNCIGYMEGAPPLRNLAELNQEHWVSSSEQRRAVSFGRFAMLTLTGVPKGYADSFVIAPDKVNELPPNATAGYTEPTGAGVAAGAADLKAIEERMQHAGMQIRIEGAGGVTATAAAIDSDDSNAGLRAVAKAIEDAVEQCLQVTADILGLASGGEVEVNDDFGQAEIPGTPTELNTIRASNGISARTFLVELKRRQVLDEDLDVDAELEAIAQETEAALQQQQDFFAAQQEAAAPIGGGQ